MRKPTIFIILISLLMPVWILADSDEVGDVHVIVTVDEAMDMAEQYDDSMPRHAHKKVHILKTGEMHGKPYGRKYRAGGHHPLNADTANCILKNISKINNDAAAHLLSRACAALNKTEE